MKCPACGFETPQEQGWCDFCKEPFRKTAKEPDKLQAPKAEVSRQISGGIPPEFAHLDSGEQIPEVSPSVRRLAWLFLGVCLFWILGLSLFLFRRSIQLRNSEPPSSPSSSGN